MANYRKSNHFTQFLLIVIILILAGYGYYYISHQGVSPSTAAPAEQVSPATKAPVVPADPATANWKTYSDTKGFSFKYPSYITIGPDSKADLGNANPTALVYRQFEFSPDPNTDFPTFSVSVEGDGAKNFILDLAQKFISFDPKTSTWYANSNISDKPTAADSKYKNLYLPGNEFTPAVYGKTFAGDTIYGPFTLGDDSRGTRWYVVAFPDQNLVVNFSESFNNDALDQSTSAIRGMKSQFDKDFSHILKSVTVSS